MIETWRKDGTTITFATEGGAITNKSGTVRGFTRDELIFNGWTQISPEVVVKKEVDETEEAWEDVDMSEPEAVPETEVEEIKNTKRRGK